MTEVCAWQPRRDGNCSSALRASGFVRSEEVSRQYEDVGFCSEKIGSIASGRFVVLMRNTSFQCIQKKGRGGTEQFRQEVP